MNDLKFAFRQLRKHPGFTAVAVLTLALGIGANTAIFSLVDHILLKMLPVQHPQELVELRRMTTYGPFSFSYPMFEQLRDRNQVFSGVLTESNTPLHATSDRETETANGQYVSGNYFSLLGVRAWTGRTITPDDDKISDGGGSPVAVISYGLWQRRFGGDPSAIGKQITVEEKPFTIIGVTPPEFFGLQAGSAPDFWIPITTEKSLRTKSSLPEGEFNWLSVLARLKPDVSVEKVRAELDVIFKQILNGKSSQIKDDHDRQIFLSQKIEVSSAATGLSRLRQQFSKPLLILMTIVGLVLLIACANIANLLLARDASRRRELAVRLALGASRFRLMRQFLSESVLLAFLGGLAGLLFAFWGSSFLVAFMSSGGTPLVLHVAPDPHILAFATAASLLTGVLFGLAPALRATQVDVSPVLKENARTVSSLRPGVPLGKVLVVSQVALSLVLVVGAGLFVGSLLNLKTMDAGFNREDVLLANVNPAKAGYNDAQRRNFYRALLQSAKRIPGVRSASLSRVTPVEGGAMSTVASVEGYTAQPNEDKSVYMNNVSPGYFATIGTALLLGRDFSEQDTPNSTKVALINGTMMNYYFRGTNPIGQRVSLGGGEPMEVIGVVEDAKYLDLREQIHRTVYRNCLQSRNVDDSLSLEVRTRGNPHGVVSALRNEIRALASSVPVTGIGTLAQQVERSLLQERLMATLSSFFGALALLLASLGLYGVMSYNVTRRTSEIGLRIALGARRADVTWMVLRETLLLVALGVAIGIPAALTAARLAASQISGLLFGLSATDARTIALAALVLAGVAMLAGYLPARRASKVDPMEALRHE